MPRLCLLAPPDKTFVQTVQSPDISRMLTWL